ncbi:hypothetical protein [Methanoculleus chikugoensis]|uniref:hypothetical protein n=1 Tax=Methanoculleus chikugoensis TaxID=118126 RepID=UPI001FB4ACB4|nr:hypothetical protein [Methanoculleus chikugoensis]
MPRSRSKRSSGTKIPGTSSPNSRSRATRLPGCSSPASATGRSSTALPATRPKAHPSSSRPKSRRYGGSLPRVSASIPGRFQCRSPGTSNWFRTCATSGGGSSTGRSGREA